MKCIVCESEMDEDTAYQKAFCSQVCWAIEKSSELWVDN